jgi:cell division septation protein DedD
MATDQDPEEFIEEDEQDEIARRSIFSAGWFRALLVLTVLAIIVVVSLPYLLNWLEPNPTPPAKPQAKVTEPAPAPAPSPSDAKPPAPAMVPAPAAPTPPAKAEAPAAPPVKPEPPSVAQAPTATGPADRPVGTAPLPAVPAPTAPPAKAAAPAAKPEAPKAASEGAPAASAEGGSPGRYFVQVGAFVEAHNAEALSKQLKAEKFPVTISRVSRGGRAPAPAPAATKAEAGGQNQLFITGSTPDAVNAALKGKGTAQPVKGGLVVTPPYDLETAMSLSSSLKKEGFKVVIRRAKAAPAATAPSGGTGGTTFHVVRVGGFPDRAKAQQVRGELEAKGHPGFLTQGAAR